MLNQQIGTSGKGSIFAWSGFLAMAIVLIVVVVYIEAERRQTDQYVAQSYHEEAVSLNKRLDSLVEDDYIIMERKKQDETAFHDPVPLKVLDVKNDEVLLGTYAAENYAYFAPRGEDSVVHFFAVNKVTDSFWVKKALLKKGVSNYKDSVINNNGIVFDKIPGARLRTLQVDHREGPKPGANNVADENPNGYYGLINHGFDVRLDSLVPVTADVFCKLPKNREFRNDSLILIQLSGKGKFILYSSDKAGHHYSNGVDNLYGYAKTTKTVRTD